MIRLRDRNKQIPFGLKGREPHTGWVAADFSSFDTIVRGKIANRMGNPAQTAARGLSLDYDEVARETDYYNALICEKMGWHDYIINDAGFSPPPIPKAYSPSSRLKAVAAGVSATVEFVSREESVLPELSETRAERCAQCPLNEKGDWLSWFTVPISEAIRKTLQLRKNMGLSTTRDPDLHVCSACLCPIRLMVHFPIEKKLKSLSAETKAALHPNCWVLSEEKSLAK